MSARFYAGLEKVEGVQPRLHERLLLSGQGGLPTVRSREVAAHDGCHPICDWHVCGPCGGIQARALSTWGLSHNTMDLDAANAQHNFALAAPAVCALL